MVLIVKFRTHVRKLKHEEKVTVTSFLPFLWESVYVFTQFCNFVFAWGRKHFALFFNVNFLCIMLFYRATKIEFKGNNVRRVFQMKENEPSTAYVLNVVLSSGNCILRIHDKHLVANNIGQIYIAFLCLSLLFCTLSTWDCEGKM